MPSLVPSVLFVCTGNVFRSKTAEFACRRAHALSGGPAVAFASAGTKASANSKAWPYVGEHLERIKLDTSGHVPRLLEEAIFSGATLAVSMNHDHQAWIAERFSIKSPLFMEIATGEPQAMPDACDLFSLDDLDSDGARKHIADTIDRIVDQASPFIERLPLYLK